MSPQPDIAGNLRAGTANSPPCCPDDQLGQELACRLCALDRGYPGGSLRPGFTRRSATPTLAGARPVHPEQGPRGAGVYAALAERGFFPLEKLATHHQNGSTLSGHVSHTDLPGIELSTGSLGHGLGVGVGMAYSGWLDRASHRVFVVMSDGECDEGSNWEAIQFAGHHRLANLVAIVDYNKIQSLASTDETLTLEPFADKWRAFNWNVREVDGHDPAALCACFEALPFTLDRPSVVIAHTDEGQGRLLHGKPGAVALSIAARR